MIKSIAARLAQGHRTMKYPEGAPPALPARFRGRPLVDQAKCQAGCMACAEACPTSAIAIAPEGDRDAKGPAIREGLMVDLGLCLFCPDCKEACPAGAISHSGDWRLAVSRREDLVVAAKAGAATGTDPERLAMALKKEILRLYGRSFRLREVSAGGCGACEADVNVLGTIGWDIGRFGIQMVASPRHADGLLVTGPVTKNMELALRKTWDSMPEPRIAIAVGSCAISGGPFAGHEEACGGAGGILPIDLWVPGCPPHPLTILDGLLRLLGKIK